MTNPLIEFNVLAKDLENAKEIDEASRHRALVGVLTKDFPTVEAAVAQVKSYQEAGVRVSIGLGAGDPAMWRRVAEVSVATLPDHVNQVLPATGYTIGALRVAGMENPLVNALITPGSRAGMVKVTTGEVSKDCDDEVSVDAAAALLADIGAPSVKFFPIGGDSKLDHLDAMVKAAVARGIPVFEPTGGIDLGNVQAVVECCLAAGATHVIPHVYTSIVDKESGRTRAEALVELDKMFA